MKRSLSQMPLLPLMYAMCSRWMEKPFFSFTLAKLFLGTQWARAPAGLNQQSSADLLHSFLIAGENLAPYF